MTRFWPSKDAHDSSCDCDYQPHEHSTGCPAWCDGPLPPGHQFTRPCPWCGRPLEKKSAGDQFLCGTCGWKG